MRKPWWMMAAFVAVGCNPDDGVISGEAGSGGQGGEGGQGGANDEGGAGGAAGGVPGIGGGGMGGSGESMNCNADSPQEQSELRCLVNVTGTAVDEAGEPIVGQLASVCGPVCYSADTGIDGQFSVPVGRYVDLSEYSISIHGRPFRALFYAQLPEPNDNGTIDAGEQLVIDMPEMGAVLDRMGTAAQSLESNGVVLSLPAGIEVRLDPEDLLAGADGSQFRARELPTEDYERFGVEEDVIAVYALGPFEAWFRDAESREQVSVAVSFPNAGLEPGDTVDVLALGTYVAPDWLPAAVFSVAATATVSDDGERIELDADQDVGIEYLTWVALRPAR